MNQHPVEMVYSLFVVGTFITLFWLLEVVWQHRRKRLFHIIVFPPMVSYYAYKDWKYFYPPCFTLFALVSLILATSTMTGHNFDERIFLLLGKIIFWPFYLITKLVMYFIAI